MYLAIIVFVTDLSVSAQWPLDPQTIPVQLAGGAALALVSPAPLLGTAACLLVCAVGMLSEPSTALLPGLGPWLAAGLLLLRGFRRDVAYGTVLLACSLQLATVRMIGTEASWLEYVLMFLLPGGLSLLVGELVRRPRADATHQARRLQEDLARQRLLVVSELHDTVVRDLTQAVMSAEQVRLAHPGDALLVRELGAMADSVRTAVDQLRASLRTMSEADDARSLDVLASSPPQPLTGAVSQARALLAPRGVSLEASGLEVLDGAGISSGVRQQLVRVLDELVDNVAKHAAAGPARLEVESDGSTFEAMVVNAVGASGTGENGAGLGLPGARRRTEALGGTLHVACAGGRWTVVLSVPLHASPTR